MQKYKTFEEYEEIQKEEIKKQDELIKKLSNKLDSINDISHDISYTLDQGNKDLDILENKVFSIKQKIKRENKKVEDLTKQSSTFGWFGWVLGF
jgi:chromosome segregation ATPase